MIGDLKMTQMACVLPLAMLMLWQNDACRDAEKPRMNNVKIENAQKNTVGDETNRVTAGKWGGRSVRLDVTDKTAVIEFDCAHGTIDAPLTLDAGGKFDVTGTFTAERGGPVREGASSNARPARYSGDLKGDAMTLIVTLTDTQQQVGTYTLALGKGGRIVKCQ